METTESQKAIELYKATLTKGDTETARLYLMNAIMHNPSLENIRLYVNELQKLDPLEREDLLPQALDVLSQAAITGPAENIAEIQSLVAMLQPSVEDIKTTYSDEDEDAKQLVEELEHTTWENLLAEGLYDSENTKWNLEKLESRLDLLRKSLASGLLDEQQASTYAIELGKTELQFNFCSIFNEFYRLAKRVLEIVIMDDYLLGEDGKSRVVAMLQQMSSLLNQAMTIPEEGLEDSLSANGFFNRTAEMLQTFRNVEKEAQVALGKDIYDKIIAEFEEFYKIHDKASLPGAFNTWTSHILAAQGLREDVSKRLSQIPAQPHLEEISKKMRALEKDTGEWVKARYACYQRKVAELCRAAVRKWDDTTYVTEDKAKQWLADFRFAEIDESLLSPEAAAVFQSIKARLIEKLSTEAKADFDYKCIVSIKMNLEDC